MINIYIKECEGIIYSLANRYKDSSSVEDLYQAGCIGVIKASKTFNNNLNVKFSTYAYNFILGEIIESIRKDRNIKVSVDYFEIYKRYKKTKQLLTSSYNREVSFGEIAKFMDIDEYLLASIIERTAYTKSLENEHISYVDENDKLLNKLALDPSIDKLDEPAKSIIRYRYYFGMTQQEVAENMSLSQAKVSREETHALKMMKKDVA